MDLCSERLESGRGAGSKRGAGDLGSFGVDQPAAAGAHMPPEDQQRVDGHDRETGANEPLDRGFREIDRDHLLLGPAGHLGAENSHEGVKDDGDDIDEILQRLADRA